MGKKFTGLEGNAVEKIKEAFQGLFREFGSKFGGIQSKDYSFSLATDKMVTANFTLTIDTTFKEQENFILFFEIANFLYVNDYFSMSNLDMEKEGDHIKIEGKGFPKYGE